MKNTGIKVAVAAIALFATLAAASFIGSKMAHSAVPFDLSKAKTVKELPPGYIPGEHDDLLVLATTADKEVVSIDASSVRLIGDEASFLIIIVEPEGTVSEEGDKILGEVFKQTFDCKKHTSGIAYSLLLSEDGKILYSRMNPEKDKPIQPNTTGSRLEKMVCTAPDGVPYKAPTKQYPKGTESI